MAVDPFKTPFDEAVEFLAQKERVPTRAWTDIREAMHARAFVVAGAMKEELLADFQNSLVEARRTGKTLQQWRADFDAIVAKHGWDYRGGRNWRSAVIYNTNMRMATAAGRWAQAMRGVDQGREVYIRYMAVLDNRTRPAHRAWADIVLPIDHPFWDTHYPPNGWNCRCSVMIVDGDKLERHGLSITPDSAIPDLGWEERTVNTPDGPEPIRVPKGIDTGFGYNVGKAAWGRGADRKAIEQHGPWKPLQVPAGIGQKAETLTPRPTATRLGPAVPLGDEAALRKALTDALGADQVILADPTGTRVEIGQALVDHMLAKPDRQDGRERYFPLLPELVTDPDEIWVGFAEAASGKVAMRRRYVSYLELARDTVVGLVSDVDGGRWSGATFFRGAWNALNNLRAGLRIFTRGGS